MQLSANDEIIIAPLEAIGGAIVVHETTRYILINEALSEEDQLAMCISLLRPREELQLAA